MADYTQPDYLDKRLRYFDGQFLKDQDFIDEQKYHIDRQRRYGRFLNVSGIVDGLTVKAGTSLVIVDPGTALDNTGKQLVLASQATIALKGFEGSTVTLVITYSEEQTDQAQAGSAGFSRFHEAPQLTLVKPGDTTPDGAITLAQLQIDKSGTVQVNTTVRLYAGVRLPYDGAAPGAGPSLRAGSTNRMDLTGDLSVSGNVGIGTTTPGANLHVNSSSGIGTWLKLNNTSAGGRNWNMISSGKDNGEGAGKLMFNDQSSSATRMVIDTAGNVGIGSPTPGAKLTVSSSTQHLQLRRESAETTGGKQLFLELYQDDPQNRVPAVWPSVRFHHSNKFWHRIEARADGVHVKTGDPNSDDHSWIIAQGTVVTGVIVMWSGLISSIPAGWALCDGQNGTPDLRDRFVMGVSAGTNPGERAGSVVHAHTVDPPNTGTSFVDGGIGWAAIQQGGPATGGHSHTVDIAPFSSDNRNHLPPYVKLAFIMKL